MDGELVGEKQLDTKYIHLFLKQHTTYFIPK